MRSEILFSVFLITNLWTLVDCQCEVNLQQGYSSVKGYGLLQTTPKGYSFCSFLGIPYAKPPVEELRFELPQPIDLSIYASSLDFTRKSPICVQNLVFTNDTSGQEDCLYLNVYTKPTYWGHPKPVIVWIHGGWGHFGSAYTEAADRVGYLMDEDVLVVTFNYRLGILGFLYRQNDNFIGNLALRDQLEVLKWVQANIASFGGDPHKVTVVGWSAGGTHIGYYLQSPVFRGFFHGAIMMSGSSLSPWAYERSSEECVSVLCKALNVPCSRGSLKNILKLLPASVFGYRDINYAASISYFGELHPCFVPTFEESKTSYSNAIVQDEQLNLVHRPIVNDVPLLIGYTVAEDYFLYYFPTVDSLSKPWNYSFVNANHEIIRPLKKYLIAGTKELNNRSARLLVPATMEHGIREYARYYAKNAHSNTYFYRFSYKNTSNTIGAFHGDDLRFIFGPLDGPTTYTDDLVRMRMVRYVTDFAKYGNPTPKLDNLIKTRWAPYTSSGLRMEISEESKMVRDVKDETYYRWEAILQCLDYNLCKKFFKLTSEW